jgi:hypothetical protein
MFMLATPAECVTTVVRQQDSRVIEDRPSLESQQAVMAAPLKNTVRQYYVTGFLPAHAFWLCLPIARALLE